MGRTTFRLFAKQPVIQQASQQGLCAEPKMSTAIRGNVSHVRSASGLNGGDEVVHVEGETECQGDAPQGSLFAKFLSGCFLVFDGGGGLAQG